MKTMQTHNPLLPVTFLVGGLSYETDAETLELMREYRADGNMEMLQNMFDMGLTFGRIKQILTEYTVPTMQQILSDFKKHTRGGSDKEFQAIRVVSRCMAWTCS